MHREVRQLAPLPKRAENDFKKTHLPSTSNINASVDTLGKAWHQRSKANDESSKCAPVDAIVVPIDPTVSIQLVYVEFLFLDDVVVAHHNSGERPHKAGVTRKEGEQTSRIVDDVPRCGNNAEDADDDCSTENVNVLGIQPADVVTEGVSS